MVLDKAAHYIVQLFQEKLPEHYFFHNLQHTRDVVQQAREMAESYHFSTEEMSILLLAAWFHDSGYTEVYEGHEKAGMAIASRFLSEQGCSPAQILRVCECIRATEMPQQPQNLMEEILCDADVSNIATDGFFDMSDRLRREQQVVKGKTITEEEWYSVKYQFCKNHHFHTEYASLHYAAKQAENARVLEQQLSSNPAS